MDVLIVGGGIGGLAAALAFARRGALVRVLERSPEISEVGAGLQVTPNGAFVLRALGVWPEVERRGIRAQAVEPRDAVSGRRLARFDLGRVPGDYMFLRRADLQGLLYDAAVATGVEVRTGAEVERVTESGVRLQSGEEISAGLVVGADGIRSVLRQHVVGPESPFFTGQVAWRALVSSSQEPVARIWMAPGRHVVTYPLRGGLLNLVAIREEANWSAEGWSHRDSPEALRRAFADAAPELRAVLARVTEVGRWGLFRHVIPTDWHKERVVLLGDAAHPTLPFLAQGANLALEDAWVLAREVMEVGPDEGLLRYVIQRRPRVTDAIAAANANARNYHLGGPRRRVAHLGLRAVGRLAPWAFLRRLDWLYGFDVTAEG
jgi:salicylate hydroxylase